MKRTHLKNMNLKQKWKNHDNKISNITSQNNFSNPFKIPSVAKKIT